MYICRSFFRINRFKWKQNFTVIRESIFAGEHNVTKGRKSKQPTTSCKSTWDIVLYLGINGLSMILCLWSLLRPLSKLLAIQDHAQNLEEQLWMGGRREVSIASHRPVTRSDLKQERLFFRGSVSTFLQLVVALMWSYDETRSKLCYITKKTWHEKGNAWQNNTCTCRRKHLSLYGQYIIGLVPNILCLFALTLYKAIPLLHGDTYCWSQWRLQRKLFRFTKG